MTPAPIDPQTLKRMLFEQPDAPATRIVALLVSTIFLVAVLDLVRRGRLREEYTPIWTVVGVGIVFLSVWFGAIRFITRAVGAWTPSSTLFFFGEVFLLVLCLNYAVRLSALTLQVKLLAQELALLRGNATAKSTDPSA